MERCTIHEKIIVLLRPQIGTPENRHCILAKYPHAHARPHEGECYTYSILYASLGVNTIRRAEMMDGVTALTAANELAIRRVFEAAGVEFIEENGGGPGVRLRKPQRKER